MGQIWNIELFGRRISRIYSQIEELFQWARLKRKKDDSSERDSGIRVLPG